MSNPYYPDDVSLSDPKAPWNQREVNSKDFVFKDENGNELIIEAVETGHKKVSFYMEGINVTNGIKHNLGDAWCKEVVDDLCPDED